MDSTPEKSGPHMEMMEESTTKMKFDEALVKYVGSLGRYQLLVSILVSTISIPICLCCMAIMFSAGKMEHWCNIPQPLEGPGANLTHEEWLNLTVPMENTRGRLHRAQCKAYNVESMEILDMEHLMVVNSTSTSGCSTYDYDHSTYESTVISQWDLVCDRSYLVSLIQSLGMAGFCFGGLIGGISDRFGRRLTVIISLIFSFVITLATSFSPNLPFFMAMTFLLFSMGIITYVAGFAYVVELLGPRWRAHVAVIMPEMYGLGYMILAGLAYMFRSWQMLYWAIMPTCLMVALPMICLMPESPRWLYATKRDEEGLKVLNMVARRNNKPTPFKVHIQLEGNKSTGQWKEFITSPLLIFRSIIILYAWFVAACTYYGLTFSLSNLAGSIYLNLLVSGALEIAGSAGGQFLSTTRLGRRISTCLFYVLAGLALLLVLAVPSDMPILVTVLATFGRFCSTGFYTTIYIWTAELYPTVVRSTGMSWSSALGKIGGICAPFVNHLDTVSPWLPPVIFGTMSLLAGLFMLLLPETRGRLLPQTITEMKTMARKEKKPIAVPEPETKRFIP